MEWSGLEEGGAAEAAALEHTLLRVQQGDLGEADELLARCQANPQATDVPLILEATIEGSLMVVAAPGADAPRHRSVVRAAADTR